MMSSLSPENNRQGFFVLLEGGEPVVDKRVKLHLFHRARVCRSSFKLTRAGNA